MAQDAKRTAQTPSEKALEELGRAMSETIEAQGLTEEALLAQIKESRQEFYEMTYGRKGESINVVKEPEMMREARDRQNTKHLCRCQSDAHTGQTCL